MGITAYPARQWCPGSRSLTTCACWELAMVQLLIAGKAGAPAELQDANYALHQAAPGPEFSDATSLHVSRVQRAGACLPQQVV